jgi:bla regulator protein blaR1
VSVWNLFAARVVDWLVATSWQAGVLAILVVLVQAIFQRILSARWRYLLWFLLVGRLLIPALPESPTSLYRYVPASPVITTSSSAVPQVPVRIPLSPILPIEPVSRPAVVQPAIQTPPEPLSAKGILFALWLCGMMVLSGSLLILNIRFRRWVRRDGKPAAEETQSLANSIACEMGLSRHVALVETASLDTPAVVGLFAPRLLLPDDLVARLTAAELALVFRHEMSHLKRHDLWINYLVWLLQIVHWFNPVLWWAFSRMRHDRELATDALALRSTIHAQQAYGETLVKLAAGSVSHRSLNLTIGILENHRRIRQRIEQIARLKPNAYAWSALGLALLTLLATLALTKAPARDAIVGAKKSDSSGEPRFRFVVDRKDVKLDAQAQAHVIGEVEGVVRGLNLNAARNPGNSFDSLTTDMIEKDGNYLHVAYPIPRTFATAKGSIRAREVYIVNDPDANLYGFPPGGIVLVSETGQVTHAYGNVSEAPLLNLTFSQDVYPHLSDQNRAHFNDELSGYFNFSKDEELEPPLRIIAAAKAGDLAEIKALLGQGVKLDELPGAETTLLFAAGSPEVAEFLISQGVKVDARNKGTFTALMAICYNDSGGTKDELIAPTARVLLKHGADPNAHTEFPRMPGCTPLMLARNAATVDVLVEGGADVHARFQGMGLLDELDWGYKQLSYFQALAAHGLPIDNHENGLRLLNHSLAGDENDLAGWVLDRGVDPNAIEPAGYSFEDGLPRKPLVVAAWSGNDRAIGMLIAHGAKIDADVVRAAIDAERDNVVEALWKSGAANVSELFYEVDRHASVAILESVLVKGVPADPPQDKWLTPLALAARHGDLPAVQLLLKHGADPNRNNAAAAPLASAASMGNVDVVEYLLKNGARANLETAKATIRGYILFTQFRKGVEDKSLPGRFYRVLQDLVDAGTFRGTPSDQMTGVFFESPGYGFSLDPNIVKILLKAGLDPTSKNAKGQSALDVVQAEYARATDAQSRVALGGLITLMKQGAHANL